MFKFLFPLGARLSIVIDSIEYFFNTLHEKKENKIHFGEIPPEDPEAGDLWISYAIDHNNLSEKEFPISANIEQLEVSDQSLSISATIDDKNDIDTVFTPEFSKDGNWLGYLQGNYGQLTNDWILDGNLNWFAVNTKCEIWFEALGKYSEYIKVIIISIDNKYTLVFDGLHDVLKREKGFINDWTTNDEVYQYIRSKTGEPIKLHVTVIRY